MPHVSFCHKGDCRKEATYKCSKLAQQYCDEHWSIYVQDNIMHFDCKHTDHSVCNANEISIADQISRSVNADELRHLEAYKKYIEMYGDPEQREASKSRIYFIKDTAEEVKLRAENIKHWQQQAEMS